MGGQAINLEEYVTELAEEKPFLDSKSNKKFIYIVMISFDMSTSKDNSTPKKHILNFEAAFEKEENAIDFCLHNDYVKDIEKKGFADVVKLDEYKPGLSGTYHYEHGEVLDMENLKLMYEIVNLSDPEYN